MNNINGSYYKRKELSESDSKTLWGMSGGECMLCGICLIDSSDKKPRNIGIHAHIVGLSINDARFRPSLTNEYVNGLENILLLCPLCHTKADKKPVPDIYSEKNLKIIKEQHIKEIAIKLGHSLNEISFEELQIITRYISSSPYAPSDLKLITPTEKIEKNKLSNTVATYILQGLVRKKLVEEYLQIHPSMDFGNRLKNGLLEHYNLLVAKGYTSDPLFYEMWSFCTGGSFEEKYRAAGLAVLTHFFEICDLFEK